MRLTKLRILILCRALPFHHLGGMEAVAWDLARAMAARGHSIVILTTSCAKLSDDQTIEGVRIVTTPAPSGRYSRTWDCESVRAYRDKFEGRTDVVLSISAAGFALVRAIAGGNPRTSRPALVMQAHGTSWGELISKLKTRSVINALKGLKNIKGFFLDFQYRHFDAVVGVGEAVTHDMKLWPTRILVGDKPTVLIRNGIDESVFAFDQAARFKVRALLGVPNEARILVSASRLHPQKGVSESLEGYSLLLKEEKDIYYVIAGAGPDEQRLRAVASRLGIAEKVIFTGAIDRSQLNGLLSSADAFIFTSLRVEGLPLNVLEALANGLMPVISNHLTNQGFPAIAVCPSVPEDVRRGLSEALSIPGPRGVSRLPQEFSLLKNVEKYEALFRRVIEGGV